MSMGESASAASHNGASAGAAHRFDVAHLDVHGIDTAVLTAGPAGAVETAVFFHGAGTATGFDCLLPIADRRRLVVAHHPGFGASGDPALGGVGALARHQLDVLDALGIERCSIIGHSMGGWTAATLASFTTDRIDKLVLVAPAGLASQAHPIVDLRTIPEAELLSYLTADMSIFGPMDGPPPPAFLAARAREAESLVTVTAHETPASAGLARFLHRIDVPTLVLWGDADRVIPVGQAGEWAALLPHATMQIFAGAGHLLLDERADAVAAISEFLDRP